jgi:hypothetical protein
MDETSDRYLVRVDVVWIDTKLRVTRVNLVKVAV